MSERKIGLDEVVKLEQYGAIRLSTPEAECVVTYVDGYLCVHCPSSKLVAHGDDDGDTIYIMRDVETANVEDDRIIFNLPSR